MEPWLAFAMAMLCSSCAVAFAIVQNNRPTEPASPQTTSGSFARQPEFVERRASAPIVPSDTQPKKLPPIPAPPSVHLVPVYPGGWVWNPYWHDHFYWKSRLGRPRDRWDDGDNWHAHRRMNP